MTVRQRNLQRCLRCEGGLAEIDRMVLPNTGWCCACFEEVALKREYDLIRLRAALKQDIHRLGKARDLAVVGATLAVCAALLCALLGQGWLVIGFNLLAAASLTVWWWITGRKNVGEVLL